MKNKIKIIQISIILLAAMAVYSASFFNGFVYDDQFQVVENPWIKDSRSIPDIFSHHVWHYRAGAESNYYRPMMHIFYMGVHHLFGADARAYHSMNILFHAGVAVMVFIIASKLLINRYAGHSAQRRMKIYQPPSPYSPPLKGGDIKKVPAPSEETKFYPSPLGGEGKGEGSTFLLSSPFLAALLFAVHPIHTEAVAWVSAFPELSFSFFFLLSMYMHARAVEGQSLGRVSHYCSLASYIMSLLCKESALSLPLVLVLFDYVMQGPRIFQRKRYLLEILGPYLAATAIYLAVRSFVLGQIVPAGNEGPGIYYYFLNIFPLFVQYVGKLILPVNLNALYSFHPVQSLLEVKSFVSIAMAIAFAAVCIAAFRKSRILFFGLLFTAVTLLPALYIPALAVNVFAERYLYLPSLGFVMLFAQAFPVGSSRLKTRASLLISILLLVTAFYSVATIGRIPVWKDNYSLWTDTARKSPDSSIAHNNLGYSLNEKGLTDEAIYHYNAALRLNPDHTEARNNLGVALLKKGRVDDAAGQFRKAPDDPVAHNNLGHILSEKGLLDEAIYHYNAALRLNPNHAEARNNLGVALFKKDRVDEAIEQFRKAILLKPDYPEAHYNLGIALGRKGLTKEAYDEMTKGREGRSSL